LRRKIKNVCKNILAQWQDLTRRRKRENGFAEGVQWGIACLKGTGAEETSKVGEEGMLGEDS